MDLCRKFSKESHKEKIPGENSKRIPERWSEKLNWISEEILNGIPGDISEGVHWGIIARSS